eukprot:SRR837773.4403.p1 GENE.SRR837773.4403~~SRR837773.4403.p1  ORF type:complete len:288 (-),score=29.90 SRR837773.4403:12-875(-)
MCLCSLAACCCSCIVVTSLTLAALVWLVPSGPDVPRCFHNAKLETELPLAPSSYPEAFQGMLWMDQGGFYSHSDVPFTAPDLALSFGDAEYSRWDPVSRTLSLDIAGPSWTWMNRVDGHLAYWALRKLGYFYLFEPNEDFSVIQVLPSVDWGALGKFSLPKQIMSFTMERVQHAPGACPPKAGASKKDIAKCATWDRVSSGLLSPLLGPFGVVHYYVWQIVDGSGKRIQPYYDVYQSFANKSSRHFALTGSLLGMAEDPRCAQEATAFAGHRPAQRAAASAAGRGEL